MSDFVDHCCAATNRTESPGLRLKVLAELRSAKLRKIRSACQDRLWTRCTPSSRSSLWQTALRLYPDRIIVGEVRGPEALTAEFKLHEVVSVQVIRRLKGKVRADAQGQPTDHWIANVEVV